jgi:thiamine kinase-like enzyme
MHKEITIPELTEVVARLAALLGARQGGVAQLEGGITNRNYRVNFGGRDYVVRLPGKRTELLGIDREAERVATKAGGALGIAPTVAAMLEQPPCLVTSFIAGRQASAAELREPHAVETVAGYLRRFHDSATQLGTGFDSFALVESYAEIAGRHGGELPDGYAGARATAEAIRRAIEGHPEHAPVPAHNDLLTANFLLGPGGLRIIDWEYAGMGDRWFDIGNFAVNNQLSEEDEERLLSTYFGEPPDERQRATLKLFRFMSDFREAMWGVVQTTISELDFDFRGYARIHFDRLERTASDPRFRGWIEAARA